MTEEQKKISIKNKRKARAYFGIIGQPNLVLHHINPDWRHNDIERYIQWNIEDLQVMTVAEHNTLHHKGKQLSDEHRKILSETNKANQYCKGKHWNLSEETKQKMRKPKSKETREKMSKNNVGNRGMHWKLVDGKRVYFFKESALETKSVQDSHQ